MWLKQTAPASTIDIYTTCKQQHNCSLKHKNRFIENRPITRPRMTTTQISWRQRLPIREVREAEPILLRLCPRVAAARRWRQQLFTLVELAATSSAELVVTWQTAVPGLTFYHNMPCGGLSGAAPQLAADSSTAGVHLNYQSALITRYSLISPFYITNNKLSKSQNNMPTHTIVNFVCLLEKLM